MDRTGIEDGQPSKIRSRARQLTTVASTITTVAGMLEKVSTFGAWESPAGDAFAEKVGGTPTDLFAVGNRLLRTAQIIRPYADLLEASQEAIASCDTDAHTANRTKEQRDRTLEGMADDDPDRPRVQRERGEAAVALARATRRFEQETAEASADESRMAAKLYAVCEPTEDPVLYDYFEFMTGAGRSASEAGIFARPIALAGIAEPIGLAGRRAVYGEGSYSAVASSSVRYGLDTVSFGAGRVVQRAKQRFVDKEVSRVEGLTSKPVRIKDNPIIKSTPPRHHGPLPSRVPAGVRDTVRRKSGADDLKQAFDDWETIAGEGRVAKVAVVVQHSATQGNRVRRSVSQAKGEAERLGGSEKHEEREREQRRRAETARRMAEGPGR